MTVILLILSLFVIMTSRYTKTNMEYMSKDHTNIIKGIFLCFVFMSHFKSYVTMETPYIDTLGVSFIQKMGQLMVTMFLFYSGYGIMESVKNKKDAYINAMPKHRILPTLIHFDIAVLIYMFLTIGLGMDTFNFKKMALSLIGWSSYGNSNWYIFCILILYFIAYLSLKSFQGNRARLIAILSGTILYTLVFQWSRPAYVYNTAFCFVLGTAYSMYKKEIELWIDNKELISFIYLLAIFIVAYHFKNIMWCYYLSTISFVLLVVITTRKIKINNVVLRWVGKNLFPLYIFQRLPMIVLGRVDYMQNNPYIFFICSLIITVAITVVYNFAVRISNYMMEKKTT